jgi:Flp pilus assembly protein TadB
MIAVGLLAFAFLYVYRLVVPARPDLASGVRRWDSSRTRATRVQHAGAPEAASVVGRAQVWIADLMLRRQDIGSITRDLAVTDSSIEAYVGKVSTLMVLGFLGPLVVLGFFQVMGLDLPFVLSVLAGLGLAATMVPVARQELSEAAVKRRAELRRTLSIYLDLVGMSLQAGRGHAEALPAAAAVGHGWAFTHLQDAIDGARYVGTTPWRALGELGERFGVRQLTDLDAALTLAAEDGAKVRATLIARAQTLRDERLADAERMAAQATESMRFTLIVMVFAFLAYELYPPVARLFAG